MSLHAIHIARFDPLQTSSFCWFHQIIQQPLVLTHTSKSSIHLPSKKKSKQHVEKEDSSTIKELRARLKTNTQRKKVRFSYCRPPSLTLRCQNDTSIFKQAVEDSRKFLNFKFLKRNSYYSLQIRLKKITPMLTLQRKKITKVFINSSSFKCEFRKRKEALHINAWPLSHHATKMCQHQG